MALDRRGPTDSVGEHPSAERLAEFAEGILANTARAEIERHLADCPDCRDVLADTMAFLTEHLDVTLPAASPFSGKPAAVRPRRTVLAVGGFLAAAAVLLIMVGLAWSGVWSRWFGTAGSGAVLDELVAAVAAEPVRPVEGRLAGRFRYAPAPAASRGAADRIVSPDVRIATAGIEKRAAAQAGPETRTALGVTYIVVGDFDMAIAVLEEVSKDTGYPDALSDLSAALLARAAYRPEDLSRALAVAEQALATPAAPMAARFNRALALERLGRRKEAEQAWRDAARYETDGEWRAEMLRRAEALAK